MENNATTSKNDKFLITTIVIVLMVILALALIGFLFIKQGPDTIQGQGEATEIRISGKLPGRVAEVYVEEGQYVHAGDTLVHIVSALVDAQYDEARAMESAAKAAEQKVDAGTRTQLIQAAKEVWEQAKAGSNIAETTWQRMENLFKKGVVSAQKRDEAKAAYEVAKAGEAAAKSSYELAASGAQQEDKNASSAMVNVAKSGVKIVDALLEDQYLTAPCDGEIIVIYPNVSELIATGAPVMTLQKDDHWAVFNVRETLLKDLSVGSKIRVNIPALELDTVMEVFYIKDLGTYANWQATKAQGDYDARTFKVKARPAQPIKNFRPGMSVIYEGVEK
jgi:HlyD family secretion protein